MGTGKHREWRRMKMSGDALRDWKGDCFVTGETSMPTTTASECGLHWGALPDFAASPRFLIEGSPHINDIM